MTLRPGVLTYFRSALRVTSREALAAPGGVGGRVMVPGLVAVWAVIVNPCAESCLRSPACLRGRW